MAEGKSIQEIHLGFVEQLNKRGEQVVQPRGEEPMGVIEGYDKTIGLISAGSIFKEKDGTFSLLQDMLTHAYTGVKWEDLGLCDARCWYEAGEDRRMQEVNKEWVEKQAATLLRVELSPLLKQEHVIRILSSLIDAIQREKESHTQDGWNPWKQEFLNQLKVPIDIKKMLGYDEE